jgi:regulatory protein
LQQRHGGENLLSNLDTAGRALHPQGCSVKAQLSLKGRALQLLVQREHSRSELRRKLMPHALKAQAAAGAAATTTQHIASFASEPSCAESIVDEPAAAEQVESLLDWLQAHRYLSEERFVESRVHARAARFGNLRIRQELAQHGVDMTPETLQQLKDSEVARAAQVWQRKFGCVASDAAERARQMRFLARRGFSSEVIHRIVRGNTEE